MNRPTSLRFVTLFGLLAAGLAAGCATTATTPSPAAPAESVVRFTILQLNDVYEITPVEAGKRGGLARVATLRKRLLAANPNTFIVVFQLLIVIFLYTGLPTIFDNRLWVRLADNRR